MLSPVRAQIVRPRRSQLRRRRSSSVLIATIVLAVSLAAASLAASTALTIGSASNSMLSEQVVINAQGRTLYALSPETTKHLLCKSKECFKHWPPLTVSSSSTKLKNGAGVQGHLGILHRSNGVMQVTLRGLPLYRYSQDHAKGDANGDGIESFGGTWHAVKATSAPSASKPSAPSGPAMPSPAPPNPYPAY